LRGERELVEIRAELTLIEAQTAQARARLLELLPPGTQISKADGVVIPDSNLPPLPELLSRAVAARSEIRADTQLIARLQLEERAAGRSRYPEPVVAAGLKRADVISLSRSGLPPLERTQNGSFVGITIPIPSLNRGQAEVSRLQAERTRVEAHQRALEHQIRAQVTGAYQLLTLRRDVLDRYRRELGEASQDLVKIAQVAYQEGEVGILELLDVFRLTRQSQQRMIELGGAVREARIELERVAGEEVKR
jgi:cobalt-zinc-cadmium efflux system outer membrane protein